MRLRGGSLPGQDDRAIARPRLTAAASYFLVFLGAGVYMPYVPLYLAHLGASGWQIGAVVGVQPLVRWTSAVAWAYVADRWRLRGRLLVWLPFAGGACLVPLLVSKSLPAVALTLTAVAVCHGPLVAMLDATVLEHLARLGGDYGRLRLWGSASFVLGAAGSAPLVAAYSPDVVPVLLLVPGLLLPVVLSRLPRASDGGASRFQPPWRLLTPPLRAMLATVFLVELSSGTWNGFFALHTSALGLPASTPGVTWGLAVLAEIVLFRSAGTLVGRVDVPHLVLVATALTAVRWVLTASLVREPLVIAVQLGHAVTFSALHLAAQVLITRLVPADSTTGGQAVYGMARFGAGGAAGVWLAGALVDRLGTRALFVVDAGIALAAMIPALRLGRLSEEVAD